MEVNKQIAAFDAEQGKKLLDYVIKHDKLPGNWIGTLGVISDVRPEGEGHAAKLSALPEDDLERTAETMQNHLLTLISKYNRKVCDTVGTLDFILSDANRILSESYEGEPGYKELEKAIKYVTYVTEGLCRKFGADSEMTIKQVAEADEKYAELHKQAYEAAKPTAVIAVEHMLETHPEYKSKIKKERLVELLVNMPYIVPLQAKLGMMPSDVKP